MDDHDVRRLEDRIDAVSREGQLRLETVLARIDGRMDAMDGKMGAMFESISAIKDGVAASRTWAQVNIGVVVTLFALSLGLMVTLKQVWIGGVQVGQTLGHQSDTPAKAP